MIGNGANAGNLSPFSTVGAIAASLMERAGLSGHSYRAWAFHALAHVLVAMAAYLALGGWRAPQATRIDLTPAPFEPRHRWTLLVTLAWILAVLFGRVPLGPSGFAAALVILLPGWAAWREAFRAMPWKVILLVTSISTAVGLLERAGGLAWFQDLLTRYSDSHSIHAVIAFLTGVISAYSSTSGVVLPAFLPMAPGIAARLPGTDPVALSISIIVGSALVDVSPLSTIGALAIAATPKESSDGLFRKLLLWGFAMAFAGAAYCWMLAPWFRP
jgi:di/tricarboxylate transporter